MTRPACSDTAKGVLGPLLYTICIDCKNLHYRGRLDLGISHRTRRDMNELCFL